MALDSNERMLNQHAAVGVPVAALGLFIVFALLALMQGLIGLPMKLGVLTATLLLVALLGGATWLWLRNNPASAKSAHPILFCFVVGMAIHHAIVLWLLMAPEQTINQSLAALACALFMSSRHWFLAALLVCIASWLPAALLEGPFSQEWRYWTAIFATSLILAVVAFEAKRKAVIRAESLRDQAEQALATAETAMEKNTHMEKALHEAQRREALGKLAGGIAHDFNNLLAIIVGNIELLRQDSEPGSEYSDRLQVIDEAANRAALLTKQILVYAGKAPPKTTEIDLGQHAAKTLARFQSSVKSHTSLVFHEPDEIVSVKADGALIDQVIVNLVQNAVDACPTEGGQIDVRVGYTRPAPEEVAEYAFVEVTDTGRGMDERTQQQAFDPFFTTKKQGSSGLGLAVVKGIAESHGAEIKLRSSANGTIARFVIPTGVTAPVIGSPGGDVLPSQPLASPVLVVDDDRGVLQIAESFLQTAGYSVLAAESGASAMALVKEGNNISAALIDLTMPEMPGLDLAVALRAECPDLPVVIMSGFDRDNALGENTHDDDFVFLPKPFQRAQLVDVLTQAVEQAEE